jgi:hypothetical protein
MDNAFAAVGDVPALQAICDSLGEEQIRALLAKWLRILPHPFTEEDIAAGYRYDVSIVQAEFCLTQMLDRPVTGRIFLEQMIRDNLDIGRPDKVSPIFGRRIHNGRRRPTPGEFRTRVITGNVTPTVRIQYKKTKVKQYHNCDMRSHAVSGCVERRAGSCRGRSPGQRRKTCPRRDVRAGLLGWRVRSSRESPRVPVPSGGHRRGEGRAGVNASELLLMPR